MLRLLRYPVFSALLASTLVWAAVTGLREAGALEWLELAAYDRHIRLRPAALLDTVPVVLVTVTEQDIQKLGTWPVPDAVLARALNAIAAAGARAIALDIYRDVPVPPGTEELAAVFQRSPNIVAAMMLPQGGRPGVAPPTILKGTERIGFTDLVVDPGGTVRRGLLVMDDGKDVFYSLPLRVALAYLRPLGIALGGDPDEPAFMRIGRTKIEPFEANDGGYVRADAGGYQFLIDFRERPHAFPALTLGEVLAGQFDGAMLRDKLVLFGVTADSVKDSFYTPYSGLFGDRPTMYGVELHGHIVAQLVRAGRDGDRPVATIADWAETLWILFGALAGGAVAFGLRSGLPFALAVAGGVVLLALGAHTAFVHGWWIPFVPPALGWVGAAGCVAGYMSGREKRERAQLMGLFGSFVSPELADYLWNEREHFLRGGRPTPQRLPATIFFADVMSFTTVSERLEPQVLMNWFYEFMETTTPLVSDYHGVILRFLGDSIMAAFGPPIPRKTDEEVRRDAVNAVDCALAIQERIVALNRRLSERGWPLISMRIGVLSGTVVGGSIGTEKRFEYNVHGDTVNTASRLESFDKDHFDPDYLNAPCRILIGEPTLALVGETFRTEFVGEYRLKGKTKDLRIYRVHGRSAR